MIQAYLQVYQVTTDERDRFITEFQPVAERQVRRDLIIDTLAEREKLAATEADVDERVAEVATKRSAEPGQVYASLQKAGRLKEIERSITEDKVFAWLLERNTVEQTNPDEHRSTHVDDLPPVRHRAVEPRRAQLRHLLAAAHGPDHLPRHADQRRRGEHHHRPAAVPPGGQPGARHPPVHQLAGRQRVGGVGDLRHDAVPEGAGEDDLHGHGGQHGCLPPRGRPQGQAHRPAPLADHDPPAVASGGGRARRRTSRSRPRRSSTCARSSTS